MDVRVHDARSAGAVVPVDWNDAHGRGLAFVGVGASGNWILAVVAVAQDGCAEAMNAWVSGAFACALVNVGVTHCVACHYVVDHYAVSQSVEVIHAVVRSHYEVIHDCVCFHHDGEKLYLGVHSLAAECGERFARVENHEYRDHAPELVRSVDLNVEQNAARDVGRSVGQGDETQGAEAQYGKVLGVAVQGAEAQGAETQGDETQGDETQGAGAETQGAEAQYEEVLGVAVLDAEAPDVNPSVVQDAILSAARRETLHVKQNVHVPWVEAAAARESLSNRVRAKRVLPLMEATASLVVQRMNRDDEVCTEDCDVKDVWERVVDLKL